MSETEKFDAIIIGAGPAGIACAYTLAKAGKEVLVIERADNPGGKNLTGGRLYTYALEMLEEGLSEEAALERKVTHEQIMILSEGRGTTIDYFDSGFSPYEGPPQSYTVLRARFDEWLAGKAEEVGANIVCGIRVDDVIEEAGKIKGIIAGDDEIYSDIVIAADGVNSFIAQRAGLIPDIPASSVGVGVKEIIQLDTSVIEERFHLQDGEGAARMILGCTEGLHGGGFLYTNIDTISLGLVLMPEEVAAAGKPVAELFQEFKNHPAIYPLIAGGSTVEYGAHLVSEDGYHGLPKKLYREGLLLVGDAAGFVINSGYSIRGIDLAILSGIAAANGICASSDIAKAGPQYIKEMEKLNLLPTLKAASGYRDLLNIPRIYSNYPYLANDFLGNLFTVNGEVAAPMKKSLKALLKKHNISFWQLFKDGLRGYRAL
ncbi:MAG: FAD-dependent oxidoreductase [Syntrophomonadaceae bacterium]|nr:FAD-dependent oxidoreductase [Syntrophomonadaceae bacterium]